MGNCGSFGYTNKATAWDIVKDTNLEGKNYFVTGCNVGCGYEAVKALYNAGATVTMACRSKEKMEKARDRIIKEKKQEECKGELKTIILDLSSTESINQCIEEYKSRGETMDVLINNAGLLTDTAERTKEGFNYMMGTNHIGTHILTMGLLSFIKEGGRIVVLSSVGHKNGGGLDVEDLKCERLGKNQLTESESLQIYCQSKLCNLFFARELDRKLKEKGKKITVVSVHPGSVQSNFGSHAKGDKSLMKIMKFFQPAVLYVKNCEEGAATETFCAVDERVLEHGGKYFADCDFGSLGKTASDEEKCKKLWEKTVELTGKDIPDF